MEKKKGITLIALVVTIIVLIILAGVSISLVLGQNGVISKAKQAQIADNHAKVYETLQLDGMDYWADKVIEEKEDTLMNYFQEKEIIDTNSIVHVQKLLGTTLSTGNGTEDTDIYVLEEIEETENSEIYLLVYYDKNKVRTEIGKIEEQKSSVSKEIYSEPGAENKIAPADLFEYEIISDGQVATTNMDLLPVKEARITRIKPEYCNEEGYNPKTGNREFEDTNYEIIYNGTKISDTLVIPYQVKIGEELYKITEVNLLVKTNTCSAMPKVETIIFPNTVKKIGDSSDWNFWKFGTDGSSSHLERVVLPNKLKEINDYAFCGAHFEELTIPKSVIRIGNAAFAHCSELKNIVIPKNVTYMGSTHFINVCL